jgi:hypothetical protein
MNVKAPHYLQIALSLASVIVVWAVQQTTAGNLVLPAAVISALTLVQTVLGLFSTSVSSSRNAAAAVAASALRTLMVVSMVALTGVLVAACPAAVPIVGPAADCGVAIIEDAVAGMSVAQIVAKEGQRCGVDFAAVVATLLGSKDPRLEGKPAMVEARAARADSGAP